MSEEKKIKVKNWVDGSLLKQDLAINPTDIHGAMVDQASISVHYGELAAKAERQVDDVKLLLENTEAAVDRKLRDEAAKAGEKTTEPGLEKKIARHPRVIAMKRALNEAKQIAAIAKAAYVGFRDRKDLLVQLGAKDRAEMEGQLRIAVRQSVEERNEERAASILAKRNAAN